MESFDIEGVYVGKKCLSKEKREKAGTCLYLVVLEQKLLGSMAFYFIGKCSVHRKHS